MSMYVRVKRDKMTVFLHVDPSDTVSQLKGKLEQLVQKAPEDQRLFTAGGATPLDDDRSLAELKVENDDVLALALKQEDGIFEAPHIAAPDAAAAPEQN